VSTFSRFGRLISRMITPDVANCVASCDGIPATTAVYRGCGLDSRSCFRPATAVFSAHELVALVETPTHRVPLQRPGRQSGSPRCSDQDSRHRATSPMREPGSRMQSKHLGDGHGLESCCVIKGQPGRNRCRPWYGEPGPSSHRSLAGRPGVVPQSWSVILTVRRSSEVAGRSLGVPVRCV